MSKVIMFSRQFPAYHPRAGEPTFFVEKFWKSLWELDLFYDIPNLENAENIHGFDPKYHTIRAGHRFKAGDYFSPRVWSGKPYCSKHIIIAKPDIKVVKTWDFEINSNGTILLNGLGTSASERIDISSNDGLKYKDFLNWFKYPNSFTGQIICWSDKINY